MCEMYVKADPIQYEPRSRSVRVHGVVTSIRLENLFWDILADMAADEGTTTNHLIATFHDEILAHRGEVSNFASFLRVTCLRYLQRRYDVGARVPVLRAHPPALAARDAPRVPHDEPREAPRMIRQ